jgi:hypothetical protein
MTFFGLLPVWFQASAAGLETKANTDWVIESAREVGHRLERGLPYRVRISPTLSKDLVLISPLGNAFTQLECLAKTLNASLVVKNGVAKIERTNSDLKRIEDHRSAVRLGWLQEKIEEVTNGRRQLLQGREFRDAFNILYAQRNDWLRKASNSREVRATPIPDPYKVLPEESTLLAIISLIGERKLASLHSGTYYQVILPASGSTAEPAIRILVSDLNRSRPASGLASQLGGYVAVGQGLPADEWVGPGGDTASIRVVAKATASGLSVTLEGFTAGGSLTVRSAIFAGPRPPAGTTGGDSKGPVGQTIIAPDEVQRAVEFASSAGKDRSFPSWFSEPDRNEPTNAFIAFALKQIALSSLTAGDTRKCVGFAVFDNLWPEVRQSLVGGRLDVRHLQNLMRAGTPYETLDDGTSLVWRPVDPDVAEQVQCDRVALRDFIASFVREGAITVRSVARLYAGSNSANAGLVGEYDPLCNGWPVRTSLATGTRMVTQSFGQGLFRLLGRISDADWQDLLNGHTRTAGSLGVEDDCRAFLAERPAVNSIRKLSDFDRAPLTNLGSSGAADVAITLHLREETVFRIWDAATSETEPEIAWNDERAASTFFPVPREMVLAGKEFHLAIDEPALRAKWATKKVRLGRQQTLDFIVTLPSGAFIACSLTGGQVQRSDVTTFDGLPPLVQQRLLALTTENAIAYAKAMVAARNHQGAIFQETPASTKP